MKDKTMIMYDHIRSSADVDPWAIKELRKVLDAYLADRCEDCEFYDVDSWKMPCKRCRRNNRDYWRARNESSAVFIEK